MMNLHVRHHEPGQASSRRKVPAAKESEGTAAKTDTSRLLGRFTAKSRTPLSETYTPEHVTLDRSYPTILIPLHGENGQSGTIVAWARVYKPWKAFLEVMDWRLENGQAVTTFYDQTIEMSALMKHPCLRESIPCDKN